MFEKLGTKLVPLAVTSVLGEGAVLELEDGGALVLQASPRPPVVEVSVSTGTLSVLALPTELRCSGAESVLTIDVSGCDAEVKNDVVAICIACLRANHDLPPVEAINEICADGKRLEFLWDAFGKDPGFSMASLLRKLVGQAGLSQDTAQRTIKEVCPIYVACDRNWSADVANILGDNPYIFANSLLSGMKERRYDDATRSSLIERAEMYIRKKDLKGIQRLLEFTYPSRSVS